MSMMDWAEREVELAKEHERKGCEGKDDSMLGYVEACYDSALRAYRVMESEGHSGMSWSITTRILEDLLHDRPLTAIEDTPDMWHECDLSTKGCKSYQCSRRGLLFKDVYPDGRVEYHDNDTRILDEVSMHDMHICALGSRRTDIIIDKWLGDKAKITMPYTPPRHAYRVLASSDLLEKDGWEYFYLAYIMTPSQDKIWVENVVRYNGDMVEEITDEDSLPSGINVGLVRRRFEYLYMTLNIIR